MFVASQGPPGARYLGGCIRETTNADGTYTRCPIKRQVSDFCGHLEEPQARYGGNDGVIGRLYRPTANRWNYLEIDEQRLMRTHSQ